MPVFWLCSRAGGQSHPHTVHTARFPVTASAEFPNDNPELHDGAMWVCLEPCGAAVATSEIRRGPEGIAAALELDLAREPSIAAPMFGSSGADDDESDDTIEVVDELEDFDISEPAFSDPFSIFARTLAEVALAAGGSDAAALVPGALAHEATACAWRAIINGESEDFAACGAKPLDEWAAELVAGLLSAPARTQQLRRELRARGIAAFGLVLDAA